MLLQISQSGYAWIAPPLAPPVPRGEDRLPCERGGLRGVGGEPRMLCKKCKITVQFEEQ